LFKQVMEGLRVREDGTYLDGTFGRGGHARGVLQALGSGGRLLLMDKDPDAIAVAERGFGTDPRVSIFRGSFAALGQWSAAASGLDGVLFEHPGARLVRRVAHVERSSHPIERALGRVQPCRHLRQLQLDRPEVGDRLAELPPCGGVA
jgi:hypothetical protein